MEEERESDSRQRDTRCIRERTLPSRGRRRFDEGEGGMRDADERDCGRGSTRPEPSQLAASRPGQAVDLFAYGAFIVLCRFTLFDMGHCTSKDQKEGKRLNRRIDEQIKKDQSMSLRIIKLLLLGAGESGKSTILKQMRILHKDGFSQQDLEMIRPVVYSNCIHSMLSILRAMFHLQIEYADNDRVRDSQLVFATVHANKEELTEELAAAMQRLWKDEGVRECYRRSNEYQIDDSAK